MLVLRELPFRKANVCQLPDPGNSQSFGPTASRNVLQLLRLKTNPFFGIGFPAASRSAEHISQKYKPKPIPSMQFKRQE